MAPICIRSSRCCGNRGTLSRASRQDDRAAEYRTKAGPPQPPDPTADVRGRRFVDAKRRSASKRRLDQVRISKRDASLMDAPKRRGRTAAKALTPQQREKQRQQRQLARLMNKLSDSTQIFEVRAGRLEKLATIRQRLLRAAADAGKEIAVRKNGNGFLVGLMTPERRSRRGRRRRQPAKS
jgi:hypothetical protein